MGNLNLLGDGLDSPVWNFWVGRQNLTAPSAGNPVTFARMRSLAPGVSPGYELFHACMHDAWADLRPVWQVPQAMLFRWVPVAPHVAGCCWASGFRNADPSKDRSCWNQQPQQSRLARSEPLGHRNTSTRTEWRAREAGGTVRIGKR